MDDEGGRENEEWRAAEEPEETENCEVDDVKTLLLVSLLQFIYIKTLPLFDLRMICFVSAVFYCMNEKELVEAAISIFPDAPCEDVILLSGRPMAPIPKLHPTDVTEVFSYSVHFTAS